VFNPLHIKQHLFQVACFDSMYDDADGFSNEKVVSGHEYLHPDIAALLMTPASWSEEECPFIIDPTSLVMQAKSDIIKDLPSTEFMPIPRLAYLAEECERAIFGTQMQYPLLNNGNLQQLPGKIVGLICLLRLSSESTTQIKCSNISGPRDEYIYETNLNQLDPAILVATMISLNLLESSIRSIIRISDRTINDTPARNRKTGAPLLCNMIETLSDIQLKSSERNAIDFKTLAEMLRALLLPKHLCGMNLRNLISHGFLSTVQKRWFALTLVLIQTLDSYSSPLNDQSNCKLCEYNDKAIISLRKYESMSDAVSRGENILLESTDDFIIQLSSGLIPRPYLHFTRFIFETLAKPLRQNIQQTVGLHEDMPSLTTIFLTASSSLLEHSLRLQWCKFNNKLEDSIARPSTYYVTLDGYGQRDKHDIMISPYQGDGSKNVLIEKAGPVISLLSDLLSAPSPEAPNIRSHLCHGAWDDIVIQELTDLARWMTTKRHHENEDSMRNHFLADAASVITASFEMLTNCLSEGTRSTSYQPVYSYAAMWRRDLETSISNLTKLKQLITNDRILGCVNEFECKQASTVTDQMKAFGLHLSLLRTIHKNYLPSSTRGENIWNEYDMNNALSECVAAQTLLNEVANASKRYIRYIQSANFTEQPKTSTKYKRSLKTTKRICGIANIVLDFYLLAVYVCLRMMQNTVHKTSENLNRADYVKSVERTRMALSTFDKYMETNLERSLQALNQYLRGKALRNVISAKNDENSMRLPLST
jgi:hypothetical protein